jgi:hypothetical protein
MLAAPTCSPITPNARNPTQARPPARPNRRVSVVAIMSVDSAFMRRLSLPEAASAVRSVSRTEPLPPGGASAAAGGSLVVVALLSEGFGDSAWHTVRAAWPCKGVGGRAGHTAAAAATASAGGSTNT